MLNKCANDSCNEEFRYFGEGKLFLRDQNAVFVMNRSELMRECYWLCPACAARFTLEFGDSGVTLIPFHDKTA